MTITLDAATTSTATTATSKSFSHTVGTAKRNVVLFAAASLLEDGGTVSNISATYGGVSMTKVGEYKAASKALLVALFYLARPATGANTLAFSWTGASLGGFYAISLYGVNRGAPVKSGSYTTLAETSSAAPSVDVPSNNGDWVLDVIASQSSAVDPLNMTVGGGQTAIMNGEVVTTTRMAYGGSYEAGAASVTMSWSKTGGYFAIMAGMSVQPASEGGSVAVSPFLRF
jgi:hypothetical protein